MKAASGKGQAPKVSSVKLKKVVIDKVKELNDSAALQSELRLGLVAKALSALPVKDALLILESLTESDAGLENPVSYVLQAAQTAAKETVKTEDVEAEKGPATPEEPVSQTMLRVEKRVRWLQKHTGFAPPLDLAMVMDILRPHGEERALEVLKELAENASTIRQPYDWLRKKMGRGAKGEGKGKGQGKRHVEALRAAQWAQQDPRLTASQKKIARMVAYLNASYCLLRPLDYNDIRAAIDEVDEKSAMHILGRLREEGHSLENPKGWVVSKCKFSKERHQQYWENKRLEKAAARSARADGSNETAGSASSGRKRPREEGEWDDLEGLDGEEEEWPEDVPEGEEDWQGGNDEYLLKQELEAAADEWADLDG